MTENLCIWPVLSSRAQTYVVTDQLPDSKIATSRAATLFLPAELKDFPAKKPQTWTSFLQA